MLQPGALVLLYEDNLPPKKWSVGRITSLQPGADGNTGAVTEQSAAFVISIPNNHHSFHHQYNKQPSMF